MTAAGATPLVGRKDSRKLGWQEAGQPCRRNIAVCEADAQALRKHRTPHIMLSGADHPRICNLLLRAYLRDPDTQVDNAVGCVYQEHGSMGNDLALVHGQGLDGREGDSQLACKEEGSVGQLVPARPGAVARPLCLACRAAS